MIRIGYTVTAGKCQSLSGQRHDLHAQLISSHGLKFETHRFYCGAIVVDARYTQRVLVLLLPFRPEMSQSKEDNYGTDYAPLV